LSSVGIGIILLFFLYLISNLYNKFFNFEGFIDWWIPFAFFGGIILSNFVSINLWLNKNSFYKKIAILQITQALILSFFSLVMGFLSIKNGLIFSQIFTLFIMLGIFILFCELKFNKYHFIGLAKTAKKYINSIRFIYPGNILDIFSSQLPFLLITFWFSQEMTGHYRLAYSFINIPAALLGSAVSQIFYKRFSQAWPDTVAANLILKKTWLLLFLVSLPFFLIVLLAGEKILPFVLGSSWKAAGNIASILSILSFLSLLFSTTSTCFLTMKNEYLYSTYNFFVLFNRISSLYIGYLQNDLFFALKMLVIIESIIIIIFQYIILKKINKQIVISKKIQI
jgi:O-antigen/teichoic acid export membrane protein